MSSIKKLLLSIVISVIAIGIGFAGGIRTADSPGRNSTVNVQGAACGKCGDGVCVRQCGENATSCPADCGGTIK